MLAPVAGCWVRVLVTAQPPACRRTDRQRHHQTVAQPTSTPPPLTPPYGSPPAPSHVTASPPSPGTAAPRGSENCPGHRVLALAGHQAPGMQQGWPCVPSDVLKEAQQPGTPKHPHASTRSDGGQDPQHLQQLRSHFGTAQTGRGERHPSCICSGYHQCGCSLGKTAHPHRLGHHRRLSHWFKSPLSKKQRRLCHSSRPRQTTKPRGTATGSVRTGEGGGNTALSEGCPNKQEPVKSYPSQTLISV